MQGAFTIMLFVVFVVLGLTWHFGRSHTLIQSWADRNGYQILRRQYRFFKGPFLWTSTSGQTVYFVEVEDSHGTIRRGLVRCGSWWFGLLSDTVEVR
jgi:hypothetical protein